MNAAVATYHLDITEPKSTRGLLADYRPHAARRAHPTASRPAPVGAHRKRPPVPTTGPGSASPPRTLRPCRLSASGHTPSAQGAAAAAPAGHRPCPPRAAQPARRIPGPGGPDSPRPAEPLVLHPGGPCRSGRLRRTRLAGRQDDGQARCGRRDRRDGGASVDEDGGRPAVDELLSPDRAEGPPWRTGSPTVPAVTSTIRQGGTAATRVTPPARRPC